MDNLLLPIRAVWIIFSKFVDLSNTAARDESRIKSLNLRLSTGNPFLPGPVEGQDKDRIRRKRERSVSNLLWMKDLKAGYSKFS